MIPREYLEHVVEPNIAELDADYGNIRLALNVVHSLDALAAQIFYGSNGAIAAKDDLDYRNQLASVSDEFALLRDIAKAIKHVRLERGDPLVSGGDQVSVASIGWGVGRWGEGRWSGPPQAVVATNSGELRYIEQIAQGALSLLKLELEKWGL